MYILIKGPSDDFQACRIWHCATLFTLAGARVSTLSIVDNFFLQVYVAAVSPAAPAPIIMTS